MHHLFPGYAKKDERIVKTLRTRNYLSLYLCTRSCPDQNSPVRGSFDQYVFSSISGNKSGV